MQKDEKAANLAKGNNLAIFFKTAATFWNHLRLRYRT